MKIYLSQFDLELINPTVEKITPMYSIGEDEATVSVDLKAEGATKYNVQLLGFPNTDDWGDEEVTAWVNEELKKL